MAHCNALDSTPLTPESVAKVTISNHIQNNLIDAAGAIEHYFDSTERGIERNCMSCHGNKSSQTTVMPTPYKFIVVQLVRFMMQNQTVQKVNTEAEPFSSVAISTAQGYCNYDVVGVVEHIGRSTNSGHYVAYIKKDIGWIQCDDDKLIQLPSNVNPTKNAYLVVLRTNELED